MNTYWPILLLICGLLIVLVLLAPIRRPRANTGGYTDRRSTPAPFRDDERYWYGGIFYNNPDDPAMFVPKRYGLGWTLNFGHPQARLFMIGILLLILVLTLAGVILGGTMPASMGCHPSSGCHLP